MALKEKINKYYDSVKEKFFNRGMFKNLKAKVINIKEEGLSNVKFNKKFNIILLCSIGIVLFIGGYLTVQRSSKSYIIKKIYTNLEKKNAKGLSKILIVDNMNKKLNEDDLKPIINFYSSDKNRISQLTESLNEGKTIYSMNIKEQNSFLGKKYYIATKYKELNIKTDIEGANLYINDISEGVISGKEKKINVLVPGVYKIRLEYNGKDAILQNEKEISLTDSNLIEIPLNGIKISVKSDYPEGKIFINDEDTSIKAKDFKEKGPFPTDGSYKISMKYTTPWGIVSSEAIEIGNNPEITINLNLKNDDLKGQLNLVMENFFDSVFSALNKENKEEIKGTTDEIKEKIYAILNEKYFILKNIYKLNNIDIDLNKSNIDFKNNQYSGLIVAKVNYIIKKDMFGIPLQSKSIDQTFFIEVVYKNESWIISNIENFNLEK